MILQKGKPEKTTAFTALRLLFNEHLSSSISHTMVHHFAKNISDTARERWRVRFGKRTRFDKHLQKLNRVLHVARPSKRVPARGAVNMKLVRHSPLFTRARRGFPSRRSEVSARDHMGFMRPAGLRNLGLKRPRRERTR